MRSRTRQLPASISRARWTISIACTATAIRRCCEHCSGSSATCRRPRTASRRRSCEPCRRGRAGVPTRPLKHGCTASPSMWRSRIAGESGSARSDRWFAISATVPKSAVPDDGAWSSDLLSALRRLAPDHAAVIVLRFSHGYTNREIAIALNVAESTIASRLATAKERLRSELERKSHLAGSVELLDRASGALYRHGHERSV